MKLLNKLVLVCILFLTLSSFNNQKAETYSLKVEVKGLQNSKGVVQFALYNKDGSIPDENFEKYYKIGKTTIKGNAAQFVFKNLPKGTYAVNILHDENENGKIDKGFVLPIEGIGFSNFTKIGLGNKPNFKKASFEVNVDKRLIINIIYL